MKGLTRRDWLRGTGAALGAGMVAPMAGRAGAAEQAARKPNIIFILADDLGYGDAGCFGQERVQTPNLDRLAREGVRFTQCYAGSTVCAPSRCCLMTGHHTGHARVRGNARVPLLPENVTVAEVLKQAGYTTGLIGKWGLGEPDTTGIPNRQGFDYFFGYLNQGKAHNYYPEYLWRNEEQIRLEGNVESERRGVAKVKGQYSHDLFTEEALGFVEKHKDEPFFLYLAYTIPHANNEARDKGMEVPDYGIYEDKDWPDAQKGHAAMITRMDRDIGSLLDRLAALGIDEDTLIIFSSDNGPHREGGADPEFFNSRGGLRGIKRDLYEGGIRVPTMARWPGKIEAGATSDHIWAFWDFLPTAAEVAGTGTPDGIDGISFLPALIGEEAAGHAQEEHDYLYWEFHERGGCQAVRTGPWKGVRFHPEGPVELYNLDEDLAEEHNIAAEHPETVEKIEGIMAGARTESEHWSMEKWRPKRT